MLRRRLLVGTLLVAGLVGLGWLEDRYPVVPGLWLFPVLVVFVVLAGREVLQLCEAGGIRPLAWVVHSGNLMLVSVTWLVSLWREFSPPGPPDANSLGWPLAATASVATLLGLALGVLVAFLAEMRRYQRPGGVTVNVAAAVFAMVYVGFLSSFMVQLRMAWGIGAVASLLVVVKMGDTGAYAVGRLIGRHKMAPELSPGKTWEGAGGALLFAALGSWATFRYLVPVTTPQHFHAGPWWGWLLFGVLLAISGMLGDLAESLIKRDVRLKDSSTLVPGFGGVLDILDSPLMAAPVAYAFWAFELVGR